MAVGRRARRCAADSGEGWFGSSWSKRVGGGGGKREWPSFVWLSLLLIEVEGLSWRDLVGEGGWSPPGCFSWLACGD